MALGVKPRLTSYHPFETERVSGVWSDPMGLNTRFVEAGWRGSKAVGRAGRGSNPPPQFGSAPFSVKLMWELGWLYVGERRLWILHLVSWPTDANTSPTLYQPLTA